VKLSTHEDIAAPIHEVFAVISDFENLERAVLRRGAEVARTDTLSAPGAGMCWSATFDFQGKAREVTTEITDYCPPESVTLRISASGLSGMSVVELVALSADQTRMAVAVDVTAQSMTGRVLMQTLRLARGKIAERFESGIARFARELESGRFREGSR